jgi:DNA-binding response OmpR family regulator
MHKKLLLAEDEKALAEIIAESLATQHYDVDCVDNGMQAVSRLQVGSYDIVVMDVMLPGMDGFSVIKKFRQFNQLTPVIFLTSKTMPHDVVTGFECGGNDYLKKPFSMEELVIRLKVLLSSNRIISEEAGEQVYHIGKYQYDSVKQRLVLNEKVTRLTARENEILRLLCINKHIAVEKGKMLIGVWGSDNFFNARTLDVFITRLRKYLKDDPNVQVINLRGVGYKLVW